MEIRLISLGHGKLTLEASTEAEEKLIKNWYRQIIQHLEKLELKGAKND